MNTLIVWTAMVFAGIGGIIVMIPLSLGGLEAVVDHLIAKEFRIVEGSKIWPIWKEPPIPIYLKIYVFNLTNPEEIKTGAKPILQELGPFTYLETLEKIDITTNEANDTVHYRQIHRYFYKPDMSRGNLDDNITFINIPFVAVAQAAHDMSSGVDFVMDQVDGMITAKGEKLTRTHTIKELLFEGFSVQSYLDLLSDPMVQAMGDVKVPDLIKDGKMGLFKGRNGTSDGWWTVKTGKEDPRDLNRVITYDEKPAMTVWKGSACNTINGTDGMIHPPFMKKDTILQAFVPQMCRSISFKRTQTLEKEGITVYRFKVNPTVFQSVQENPDNWCFCPDSDALNCSKTGVMNLAPCAEGAPLYVSNPHYVGADEYFLKGVEGLEPITEKHQGYFDSHPKTGAALHIRLRFQFNMFVKQRPSMGTFAKVASTMYPLIWVEEGADVDMEMKTMVRLLDTVLGIWYFAKWLLFMFFTFIAGLGGFLLFLNSKSVVESKQPIKA